MNLFSLGLGLIFLFFGVFCFTGGLGLLKRKKLYGFVRVNRWPNSWASTEATTDRKVIVREATSFILLGLFFILFGGYVVWISVVPPEPDRFPAGWFESGGPIRVVYPETMTPPTEE